MINSIEADPFNPGGLYIAATAYKSDDFTPYLLKTSDYGKSWKVIVKGIDKQHFTRVIRADETRRGLLFSGTESGLYISFNDGDNWQPFQLNLPVVPVTDMAIKGNDLIIATQGRAFWIFDNLDLLRNFDQSVASNRFTLFDPAPAYRTGGGRYRSSGTSGENPLPGAVINFYLKEAPAEGETIRLDILDESGAMARSFRTDLGKLETGSHLPYSKFEARKGINQVSWDMSYPGALNVDGMILWGGNLRGPLAVPGKYTARLVVGRDSTETEFEILKNPLTSATIADIKEQFIFISQVRDKLTGMHQAIIDIRKMRKDVNGIMTKIEKEKYPELVQQIKGILSDLDSIEEALYQVKNRSSQDPLNFPIKLGNKLAAPNGLWHRVTSGPQIRHILCGMS
ncbi:MAG: hypothetical protein R2727_06930 [Bacteroidales bacterium]